MNASLPLLNRIGARIRWRRVTTELLRWLPWAALAWYVAYRFGGVKPATVVLAVALALLAAIMVQRWRDIDRAWLIRALDRYDTGLQDSGDLLFANATDLNPLQALQQARVHRRLQQTQPDLREPLPWSRLWLGAIAALAIGVALWLLPAATTRNASSEANAPSAAAASVEIQSLQVQLDIVPPPYTGLPPRRLDVLDGEIAQDSEVAWNLRFGIAPTAARLRFVGGETLELAPDGERWTATQRLATSTLYRIELDGAPPLSEREPYRIDVVPDLAPKIVVLQPERTLTVLEAATPRWSLVFEASDDYALGTAQLELTLAQGSGEQVTVSERRIALRGQGDTRTQRFEHRVDLAALGFAQGDDLIARLDVRDRRQPTPNVTRSASFILRWPPSQGADGTGVEGLVQKAMPAYFRSQRQIIIDTEALIAARPTLDADTVLSRSDAIGVDQRILRMRYGQFLGEESESAAEAPPEGEHSDDDGHDHADTSEARYGDAGDVMAAAGHLHDLPEAATLLDPATKKLLRAALDAMWQAERELRSGAPVAALPHEQRALEFIKRVQQADRIYLARVGLELPQLDFTRRLTGERPRSQSLADPLIERVAGDVAAQAWNALHDQGRGGVAGAAVAPLDAALLDTLAIWLRDTPDGIDDPLAVLAEIDALRRDMNCSACRERLALLLWPALDPPDAAPILRPRPDAVGDAYLDAIAPPPVTP